MDHDGNTTIVAIQKGTKILSLGHAKCNPNCDKMIPERGIKIATARAVEKLYFKLVGVI